MGYNKKYYVGAYLEVITQNQDFDTDIIDQELYNLNGNFLKPKENKYCFIANKNTNNYGFLKSSESDEFIIEINSKIIEVCIEKFRFDFHNSIHEISRHFGEENLSIKYGFVNGAS